jgi:hypothetical protein
MSTAPATSGTTANYGIRLNSNRMTLMTGVVVFALLGYSIPSNMLTPLLVELEAAYHISAVAAIWIGPFLFAGAVTEALGLFLVIAFHGSLAELAICMGVVGIGIGMVCSAFGLIYVEDVPPEHVGRLFGISPILATGVGGSIGGAVFAAFLTANRLPPASGAPAGAPALPSIQAFEGFWALAGGLSLLAAAFAAVYLVTYWSGFRGGDRAMVRRPAIEGRVPASVAD